MITKRSSDHPYKDVFETKLKRALWIENGVAEDGLTGEFFAVGEVLNNVQILGHENLIPIMYSSFKIIINGMARYYKFQMKDDKWIHDINEELLKYGI